MVIGSNELIVEFLFFDCCNEFLLVDQMTSDTAPPPLPTRVTSDPRWAKAETLRTLGDIETSRYPDGLAQPHDNPL